MSASNLKKSIDISERKEYKGIKSIHNGLGKETSDKSDDYVTNKVRKKEIRNAISLLEGAKRKLKRILDNVT